MPYQDPRLTFSSLAERQIKGMNRHTLGIVGMLLKEVLDIQEKGEEHPPSRNPLFGPSVLLSFEKSLTKWGVRIDYGLSEDKIEITCIEIGFDPHPPRGPQSISIRSFVIQHFIFSSIEQIVLETSRFDCDAYRHFAFISSRRRSLVRQYTSLNARKTMARDAIGAFASLRTNKIDEKIRGTRVSDLISKETLPKYALTYYSQSAILSNRSIADGGFAHLSHSNWLRIIEKDMVTSLAFDRINSLSKGPVDLLDRSSTIDRCISAAFEFLYSQERVAIENELNSERSIVVSKVERMANSEFIDLNYLVEGLMLNLDDHGVWKEWRDETFISYADFQEDTDTPVLTDTLPRENDDMLWFVHKTPSAGRQLFPDDIGRRH
jgi:hypothetical protein